MKTIIAGSRDISNYDLVKYTTKQSNFTITEVVSGTAKGIDSLGEKWAQEQGIPIKKFPANWNEHGKAAGPIRNGQMADYADALILIWDGKSRGSANMRKQWKAQENNSCFFEFIVVNK